jgi:hypothetical protein
MRYKGISYCGLAKTEQFEDWVVSITKIHHESF